MMRSGRRLRPFLLLVGQILMATSGIEGQVAPSTPRGLSPYLVALSVADLDRSFTWYRETLGFLTGRAPQPVAPGIRAAFLCREGFRLELIEQQGSRPRAEVLPVPGRSTTLQGFVKIGFWVPDVDSAAVQLAAHGADVVFGPATDSSFRVRHLLFTDLDGNLLQLFSDMPSPEHH